MGLCISEFLLKKNYKVVILDIAVVEVLKHLEKEIKEKNVLVIKADITKSTEVNNAFNKVIDNFKKIDVLVNNAGINAIKNFFEENDEDWHKVIDVNLNGVFLCCKAAIPKMIQNKYGRIVNISSMSSLKSSVFSSTGYCASKAGVIGLSCGRVENWRATELFQYVSSSRHIKHSVRISRTGLSC
ncbi:MAG: SDR family NAD(P)-dependent oxidoreductase [Candidatus Humimicrobiaceae bacterium]